MAFNIWITWMVASAMTAMELISSRIRPHPMLAWTNPEHCPAPLPMFAMALKTMIRLISPRIPAGAIDQNSRFMAGRNPDRPARTTMAMLNRRVNTPRPPHALVSIPLAVTSTPKALAVAHGPTEPVSDNTPAPMVRLANNGTPDPGDWKLPGIP